MTLQWKRPHGTQASADDAAAALRARVARARTHPFFQQNAFTDEEIAQIITATQGTYFRSFTPSRGPRLSEAFIHMFFQTPIANASDRSELGGEEVLKFMPIDGGREDSSYLMYFSGRQTPHSHGGPRKLDIFTGSEPCHVLVGGHKSNAAHGAAPCVNVQMPARSYVVLSYPKDTIHGFQGRFGAISTHYTDRAELEAKRARDDKDSMATLTELLRPDQVRLIADGRPVPCDAIRWLHDDDAPLL